jgi:ADP-ribosylglycohydrolase
MIRGLRAWLDVGPTQAAVRVSALTQPGLPEASADSTWAGGVSPFVTSSVAWSLYAFLRSPDDYWETICTAIAVGGDTDTLAAMAGAMAGARLGPDALPGPMLDRLTDAGAWAAPELAQLARECAALSLAAE